MLLLVFSGCKKDRQEMTEEKFDINNPYGYVIAVTYNNFNYPGISSGVLLFSNDNKNSKAMLYDRNGERVLNYTVNGSELKFLENGELLFEFRIENNKIEVIGNNTLAKKAELVKIPAENLLAGKTFTGIYYNPNGTVHQPKFFYAFAQSGHKVEVGFEPGTTIRSETYVLAANMAALVKKTNFVEFVMVMPNGDISCNYTDINGGTYNSKYGEFK